MPAPRPESRHPVAPTHPAPLDDQARPVIAPHCRVVRVPPREILVIGDDAEVRLTGELFCDLAAHLDGRSTVAEITARMVAEGTATADEVPQAVAILRDRGYLVDARDSIDPAFRYRLWRSVAVAEQDAPIATIEVVGLGDVPVDDIVAVITAHGIAVQPPGPPVEPAEVCVVVADDLLHPELPDLAGRLREAGRCVLLVCPGGPRPTIGPWLTSSGPCYDCLAERLRFNRQVEAQVVDEGDRMGPVSSGWTPATIGHTAAEVALEIERRMQRQGDGVPDEHRMLLIDHLSGERSWHAVVRQPQCRTCGAPRTVDDPEFVIRLTATALDAEAGRSYRRLTPTAVVEAFGHHVSPRTGVVERLQRTSAAGGVVHVVESGVNLATVRKGGTSAGFRQSASGKGITADQALAGALAEAIERYSNSWHGDEPTIVSSWDELTARGELAIDPRSLQCFSARQYERRARGVRSKRGPFVVPEEFDPSVVMEFSPAWSLTHDMRSWIPTAEAFYGYQGSYPRNGCIAQSNGCAAGTSIEDAILQGFFELVERDAVALWWYNRARRPAIDLDAYRDAYDEPYLDQIRRHYREVLDRDLWVLDVTSDLRIPAFVACSTARTGRPRALLGFGAHRDPLGAVLRSITEMNQMLEMIPTLEGPEASPGAVSGAVDEDEDPARGWWSLTSLDEDQHILPSGPMTGPEAHEHDWGMDGRENVERAVALVGDLGLPMHVLNATRPDIGLAVVKVMVPGLRHFWPRFGPGRLYDVPVDLGWIDRATNEEDLNPRPMFW